MTSHAIALSRRIPATPERVWRELSNVEDAAEILSGVSAIEMLSEPPYAVDTRWRETRRSFGTNPTTEKRVVVVEPLRRTVIVAESSGTHFTTTFALQPDGEGTLLTMEFTADNVTSSRWFTLLWRLFGVGGMRAARNSLQRDLDDIATAASVLAS